MFFFFKIYKESFRICFWKFQKYWYFSSKTWSLLTILYRGWNFFFLITLFWERCEQFKKWAFFYINILLWWKEFILFWLFKCRNFFSKFFDYFLHCKFVDCSFWRIFWWFFEKRLCFFIFCWPFRFFVHRRNDFQHLQYFRS